PPLNLIVTMDDATSTIYSAFLVGDEGTASTLRACLEVFAMKGLPSSLYTDRGSHYFLHSQGRRGDRQRALDPGGPGARSAWHRAHCRLLAGSARALGTHVRHSPGSFGEGAEACRHG